MDVSEMSAEELRREIAGRVGWTCEFYEKSASGYWWVFKRGDEIRMVAAPEADAESAWEAAFTPDLECGATELPDWPHYAEAALALCLEIAQFEYTLHIYHSRHADGHVLVSADFYEWDDNTDEQVDAFVATGDTPALALSRVALLALREEAGDEHS